MYQYSLYLVHEESFSFLPWIHIKEHMQKAIAYNHGELSFEDYKERILDKRYQLWLDWNHHTSHIRGVGVSRFIEEEKIVRILLYSNESSGTFIRNMEFFEDWCLRFGAVEIEFWGREGWKKALAPAGFSHKFTVMSKKIGERL